MKIKTIYRRIKEFVTFFSEDNIMSHSSSIAFYTLFSLPSMLIVIIFVTNLFYFADITGDDIISKLSGYVGRESSDQLKNTIEGAKINDSSWFKTIMSFAILIVSATGLLGALQTAFNAIWRVETKASNGYLKLVWSRVVSLAMLVLIGFLFAASLLIDTLIAALGHKLEESLDNFSSFYAVVFNEIAAFTVLTLLFAALFKILPDVKIKWKNIWVGSIFTSVMFSIGKFAIGFYLGNSDITSTYGAASSLVIILFWIYYLTIILLIGAEFTKIYTINRGDEIIPKSIATNVKHTKETTQKSELSDTESVK